METNKKLILDYSKWRCGEGSEYSVGEGGTALLNEEGYMCCLGQFGKQMGMNDEEMLNKGEPIECNTHTQVPLFINDNYSFVADAISINDDELTTPERKIELLKERLDIEGIELEVINKPSK